MSLIVKKPIKKGEVVLWSEFELASSFFDKFKGVMLRKKITRPVLFIFNYAAQWSIHSFFCKVAFDAVFLNSQKKIVTITREVKPWTAVVTPRKCKYLIECKAGQASRLKEGNELKW